jgi:RNA polymerase sigma-32 factor
MTKGSGNKKAPPKSKLIRKSAGHSKVLEPEVLPRVTKQLSKRDDKDESAEDLDDSPESLLPIAKSIGGIVRPERDADIDVKEAALVPSDPLSRYLEDLRKYPLLSPEQQNEMAIKFRSTGDINLAKALVTTNLRLVVKIAMEYRTTYSNVLDLIQEGNVGLMKAVSNFDPYKGTRLSYYASWWIRSYILKFLLDNFRLVKVGTTQAQKKLFYNLVREKERLEAQGIHAGPKLLASRLDVREKDILDMDMRLSAHGSEVSLDKPLGSGESSASIGDTLEYQGDAVDDRLMQDQLKKILNQQIDTFLTTLGEKERIVFKERLMSEEPKTLQEIADQFGITRERTRQIETRVVERLREHMRGRIGGLPEKKPKV